MNKRKCLYLSLFLGLILNIIIDINVKKYVNILNICFGKNIVITNRLYFIICFVIALISVLIIIDVLLVFFKKQDGNKGINFKAEDGTYGTAGWMDETEMTQVLGLNSIPGVILGKYNENIVKLPFESFFNKNMCVFGSSRKYENNRICTYEFARIVFA